MQRRSRIERLTFETDHSEPLIAMLNRSRGETASDELLLHSAGPITDLAQSSMLPCLDSIRILFFEPHYNPTAAPQRGSPLAGEVGLGAPEPLVMVIQEWHEERWRTFDEHRPASLAQALEITREFEVATASPNSTTDSSQSADALVTSPITPGGFAGLLGYDIPSVCSLTIFSPIFPFPYILSSRGESVSSLTISFPIFEFPYILLSIRVSVSSLTMFFPILVFPYILFSIR